MPVYPGDPVVGIIPVTYREEESITLSQFVTGLHCGTHLDSPFHVIGHPSEKKTVEKVSLEKCVGDAIVINVPRGPLEEITAADLEKYGDEIREVKRVLLNTGWHKQWEKPEYFKKYPILTVGAAEFLAQLGIYLLGVDMPSLCGTDLAANRAAHQTLLGKEIVLIETMANLSAITKSRIFFVGIPLKIVGREASPIRAVAIEEE